MRGLFPGHRALWPLFAVWSSGKDAKILWMKDLLSIVIDEIIGFALADFRTDSYARLIVALVLLRFFDIAKVFSVPESESSFDGAEIALDNVMAGFYTFMIIRILSLSPM